MREKITVKATIVRENGTLNTYNEDRVEMEVHDMVDYLVLKYVTKGNRLQAMPARLTTELGREENRIKDERII